MKRPWRYLVEWVKWLDTVNALLPFMIPPGLWLLWRRGGRRFLLPGAALVLHPLAMALLASFRGPGFQEGRYSIHLLPLAAAVATLPLAALTAWGKVSSAPPAAPLRLSRILAAALVVAALAGLWPAATRYGWAVQNIEAMQGHLGRWVAANTPPDARLALNDVGAIGYLSRREVVDVMGLVTPAITPYRRDVVSAPHRHAGALRAHLPRASPAQYHRRRRGDGGVRDGLEPREPGAAPLSRRSPRVYNGW